MPPRMNPLLFTEQINTSPLNIQEKIFWPLPPPPLGGKRFWIFEKIQEEIRILAENCYFKPKNRKKT